MTFNRQLPYNELAPLPPQVEFESKIVLKKSIRANRALAELKGSITNLPNPMLFIDSLHLQEARASSAIENIITTEDELFKASASDAKNENPATKEVIHYKDALWYGVQQVNKKSLITTNLLIAIVQIIKENQSSIRKTPGTHLKNPVTSETIYTPPEGESVIRKKLKSLEEFINLTDDIDPLIKMALIHYQFEAIHPFYDGNGRTGRILLQLYLKLAGLMDLPALFLSRYILKHKEEYYKRLRKVTEENDWEKWILYMLDMVENTALSSRKQIEQIEQLMKKTGAEIRQKLPKVYSKDLLEILFRLPYTKRAFLVEAKLGNPKTAGTYLNELEAAGFLTSEQVGKEKLYLNHRLMTILKEQK